jgi:hypothetical protein
MIVPNTPMADPRISQRLMSATAAEVAEVTIERLRPMRMLNASSRIKFAEAAMHAAAATPNNAPQTICPERPCRSDNLPMTGLVTASVITWAARQMPT